MKTIFNKNLFVLTFLFLLILFITGCDRVKIAFKTKINEDGSALRQIEYILTPVNDEELKFYTNKLPDLLQKSFILPQEPDWTIQKYIKDGSFYYIASREYSSINDLNYDYCKLCQFNGKSRNYISFNLEEHGNSIDYNYLEIFRDNSNIKRFSACFSQYLNKNIEKLAEKLYKITVPYVKDFKLNDARDIITIFSKNAQHFNILISKYDIIGPNEINIIGKDIKQIDEELNFGNLIAYLAYDGSLDPKSRLADLFKLRGGKLSNNQKQEFYDKLKTFALEEFSQVAQQSGTDPLGAYFTNHDMLNSYTFEYIIEVPGSITNSNGNRINENSAQWIFSPEDFFNHDYMIIIKSTLDKEE